MNLNKRVSKLEQTMSFDGPPPQWALRAASNLNTVERTVARVMDREPVLIAGEELLDKAKEIVAMYGSEEAYIASLANHRLPANVDAMLKEIGC
jgi:hypothetical protein